ncbi:hypothetical protein ABZ759_11900 [Streptomyces sp. NPDC047860]|uniref:hypothetical protein n=1 Tax=Streptomyces sp. NPDC047860 TaxID=3155743 RepID=UPI00340EC369
MLISAVPRLDPNGSIVGAPRRDADLSIRPKDAHQATPAPTHRSCNHCRTVQALDTEDCPGCDDGVRPRLAGTGCLVVVLAMLGIWVNGLIALFR